MKKVKTEKIQKHTSDNSPVGSVLIVGGGIAGMQASLDLADSGFKVYLLDKSPTIGGVMAQLDKTFPTNDCAMCIMAPKLVAAGRHLNIELVTNSEIKSLKGQAGNFEVEILKKALYIDIEKCTGCGVCEKECPIEAINPFNEGLNEQRAVYIKYPQAVPLAFSIDREICIGCGLCENLCLADAIKYDDKDETINISVGAVILSPGFDEFDAKLKGEYGYDRFTNVVTSIEFERILSASGPYKGHVLRPSDGDIPKKIAFIQCVGSRDRRCNHNYCSSVCCMYATKEAVIAKEHLGGKVDTAIFFMDMRAYGKGFDRYYEKAKEEQNVRYIRTRISAISEIEKSHNLLLKYETEEGNLISEEFNLVVLSVGLSPSSGVEDLAKQFGIDMNEFGFCKTSEFHPLKTSKPGIFVSGVFQSPKDIPETVAQSSGAAAEAGALLSSVRNSLAKQKKYPKEIDVKEKPPQIGVFVCHCGINIGAYVNVPSVVEYAGSLPDVVYAEENLFTCSQDTQKKIIEKIKEHDLNRVVVASCTPRTHEPLFQETIREAGLNPHLFEMANIRDQCSWIHMKEPEEATKKAKSLVGMAVAKARLIEPLKSIELDVVQKALVIGGGLAGMTSALSIARSGYEVFLLERESELGGNLRDIYYTINGDNVQEYLASIIKEVENNPLINVFKSAQIESIEGFVGNFKTTLACSQSQKTSHQFEHGIIIVATGAKESKPTEYLYGKDKCVITQVELEKNLSESPVNKYQSVVMIQCVGSRNDEHSYCSRVCCQDAIKNAIKIKEQSQETNVYILYRDIRTYGFIESKYNLAREKGVIFIRYDKEGKPEIKSSSKGLEVLVRELMLNEELLISADIVVLSPAIVADEGNENLAKMLKIPLNEDGFFLEAHVKLRPVDFATEGIFLAGMAHAPKSIEESISQAHAAAARSCVIISKSKYSAEPRVATVNEDLCAGCGICVSVCPYGAPAIEIKDEKRVSVINEALCKGCGSCVASCPSGALNQQGFMYEQMRVMVKEALG